MPAATDEEITERAKKLMKSGNADAFYTSANNYAKGAYGLQQDRVKAHEL